MLLTVATKAKVYFAFLSPFAYLSVQRDSVRNLWHTVKSMQMYRQSFPVLPFEKQTPWQYLSADCRMYPHWNNTHTHPFNGPLSGTTQVSRYQKGKINLDFTGARDSEWQWHQLGCMQMCTSLQTDNHASTSLLSFYRPDALPATQPTVSKYWRHK